MEPQRSSSDCYSFSSLTKQHPLCIYGHRRASKKYLFFNHIDKKRLSTFSFDDLKLVEKSNEVFQDEIFESGDQNPDKSIEAPYLVACDNTCDKYSSLTSSLKTLTKSAAELSAQILNIPFKDKNSLSWQNFASQASISKLISFDIFKKIKDFYKACSCKVSEYIVRKPGNNEIYDLRKCGSCNNYKEKLNVASTFRSPRVGDGLDSLRLEQGLKQTYNCKSFDSSECLPELCACEQCRCIECELRKSHDEHRGSVVAADSDNQSHHKRLYSSIDCAECRHRYGGVTSNLWHERFMRKSRPLGCICETYLNETNLPYGTDPCSCENCHKLMRKSEQRKAHADRGQLDLMAMSNALPKINPCYHNQSRLKKCTCQYKKYSCRNNYQDSANAVDSSNFITDSEYIKYGAMISLPLEREFVSKKPCLKTTKVPPCYKNHKRLPEIKPNNSFTKKSNRCRCSSLWLLNHDVITTACTCNECHCKHCECQRCSYKNDATKKKVNKRTPAPFRNKINRSFITLHDERNQNTDDYPQMKACPSLSEEYLTMNFPSDDLFEECDENPHMNFLDIEQQLCQKLNTKSKKLQKQPFLYSSNIKRSLNINGTVKLEASSSNVFSDYTISSHMNSENNSQIGNKYENNKCISSRSIYLTPFRKKTVTFLSDFNNLDQFADNKHKKLNADSKTTYDKVNVFPNNHKRFAKNIFGMHATSSKSTKYNEKNSNPIRKCYWVKNVQSINESSQCNTIETRGKLSLTQVANENNILFSKLQEYCNLAVHYSNSVEKAHKGTTDTNSEEVENLPNLTTRNKFNFFEDYKRSKNTIKEAQIFSMHLKHLLDTYQKANREFESVSCKLTHFNETLQRVFCYIENVGRKTKGRLLSEKNGEIVTTMNPFDNVYTKESIANTLLFDSRHHQLNSENRSNLHSGPIQSLKSTDDINLNHYNEGKTGFKRDPSKTIITEHLDNANDKLAEINPKQSKSSNKMDFSPNCNDNTTIELKQVTSSTLSFCDSDITDDSKKCRRTLNPIVETNVSKNIHLHYSVKRRNIKKQSKRYTKTCRSTTIGSNRRKLSVPKLVKRSTITETLEDVDRHNKNDKVIDKLINTNESKLSTAVTESDVSENINAETSDSATTMSTTGTVKLSKIRDQGIDKHSDDDSITILGTPLESELSIAKETFDKAESNNETINNEIEVNLKQSVNKEIKQVVDGVKQASKRWESNCVKTYHGPGGLHDDEHLMKVYSNIKQLREAQQAQCIENVHKRDCLKVSFLTVRKVSDRIISVKWQAPKVLANVQGYEVLVNGRSVQKIEDNLCCESAVTLLPDDKSTTLTVRTLTRAPCPAGLSPTAVVMYRPI